MSQRQQTHQSASSFLNHFFGVDEVVTNILGLCPSALCMHTKAISHICSSYATLMATLDTLKGDNSVQGETRAKIRGMRK